MEQNFSLYTDALLVMTSLGAALYCLRLHGQVRKLQRTDRGVGQAVKALVDATRASHGAAAELREQVQASLAELDEKYGELNLRRQEVDDLLDTIDGQMGHQMRRCTEARQLTEQALTPLVQKAEIEIHALTKALEVSSRLRGLRADLEDTPREEDLAILRSTLDREEPNPSNPFLRAVGE